MEYLDKYFVRPESFSDFVIYKTIGENRAEKYFTGTEEECRNGLKFLRKFYASMQQFIAKTNCLKNGKGEYWVIALPVDGENDKGYSTYLDYDVSAPDFIDLILSDMAEAGFNPCRGGMEIVQIKYVHGIKQDSHGRYDFIPEEGCSYCLPESSGGTRYTCLQNFPEYSVLQSETGWTFKAYDIVWSETDGRVGIEWSHSTAGYFDIPGQMSSLQKRLIYEEMRMEYLIEDIFNVIKEKVTLIEKHGLDKGYKELFESLTRDDVAEIATEYLEDHSKMIADYDQMQALIDNYVRFQKGGCVV